jgi:Emfourin
MLGRRTAVVSVTILAAGVIATAAPAVGCDTAAGHRDLVNYLRSGGVGGRSAHLTVTQGGHARVTTRLGTRRVLLSSTIRARLSEVLRKANFAHLKPDYEPSTPVPDAFTYTITHACRTVRAVDTAAPSRLQAVINVLDQIIAKFGQ